MQNFLVLLVSIYVVTASDAQGPTLQPPSTSTLQPTSTVTSTPQPSSTLTSTPTVTSTPQPSSTLTSTPKSFSCDVYGTITYNASNWVRSASYLCETGSSLKTAKVQSQSIVFHGCPLGSPVHLIMYSMPSVPDQTTKLMSGPGMKMEDVNLTCKAITSAKTFTVLLDSKIGSTQSPLSVTESITLNMHLTNSNNTRRPATVEIGETYALHVSGAGSHFMKIKKCEAAATLSMSSPVTIYDAATASGRSIGILADIKNETHTSTDTHPIMASLTGFRLVTSNIVFLSCHIEVVASPSPTARKRKRIKSQLKTASIKFEVKDKLLERSANGAQGLFSTGKEIVTIAMVVVTTYLFH